MFICSNLVIYHLFLIHIIGSLFIKSLHSNPFQIRKDKAFCSFIEIVSFGSDIQIKCNETYLIFQETNSQQVNWKFANQTIPCQHAGAQQAPLHRCNVTKIGTRYLKVPLKSLNHQEIACAYCRINHRPISPSISVTQVEHDDQVLYAFNISTSRLSSNQSFEIIWSKRVSRDNENSVTYWFSSNCVHQSVHSIETTKNEIVFSVDEVPLSRVEFIIRYCQGSCRTYERCNEERLFSEVTPLHYYTLDAIEKISCDENCLKGSVRQENPVEIDSSFPIVTTSEIPSRTSNSGSSILRYIFFYFLPGSLILLTVTLLTAFIINRMRDMRRRHIYIKTNHQTSNEGTSAVE